MKVMANKEEMKQKNELLDLFTTRNIYAEVALSQIPRLLSLMDRKKSSKTYGSFDRNYWQYKVIDFPGASFQIAILPLAMVYTTEYPNNIYYKHYKIREWAIAAMEFLSEIQNHDGGFNQDYPYIWSVAGVAFPAYSVSEAYLLLSKELNHPSKEIIIEMLKKAGKWLLNSNDVKVTNQESGAAMALYNIYQITGDDKYRDGAENKIRRILKNQSPDGWFYEYGGGDPGYLTLGIDYLAKYYQKTGDKDLLKSLKKSVDFVSYFIHPNGTMGGEYASRNNLVLIEGIEIISEAEKRGFKPKVGRFPFSALGRALAERHGEGFVRIVADESSGRILGAQMVGAHVSELIAEIALAMRNNLTIEQLARAVRPHPTYSEIITEAAEAAIWKPIHILMR